MSAKEERRQDLVASFAMQAALTAIGGSMGQAMPSEQDVRQLVRIGRTIFSEIDQPTEAPEPDEREAPPPPRGTEGLLDHYFGIDTT